MFDIAGIFAKPLYNISRIDDDGSTYLQGAGTCIGTFGTVCSEKSYIIL
jgi:hypothetical protein